MALTLKHLSGGLAPEKDLVLPGQPDHPEMRESVSVWLFEENGAFAFPRGGIEAESASWGNRLLQANFAFADGRVLNGAGRAPPPSAIGPDGRPTIIGAGPLTFTCIEPFQRWSMEFNGPALDGHVSEQIDASFKQKTNKTHVRLFAEMTMATPAWVQEVSADIENMSETDAANAAAMGLGYRFEHHFRAQGTLEIDGEKRDFKATGTRIHRQSIRRLDGFYGHCWLSALFPDGRAFGCLAYPPVASNRDVYSYNDAVIYQDGRLVKARIVEAPFLRRIVAAGDDVSVVLESDLGITRIGGVTALSTFRVHNPDIGGLNLQQGGALFTWDDQQAYGMVERSSHESLTSFG